MLKKVIELSEGEIILISYIISATLDDMCYDSSVKEYFSSDELFVNLTKDEFKQAKEIIKKLML